MLITNRSRQPCCFILSGKGPGKVGSLLGVLQPRLVLVVSVLDMLGQPVLSPVDLLTANRHLQVLEHHPELVVLCLVVDAVVVLNTAEPLLLKVKVLLHVVLQHLERCSVIRVLRNCEDVGEEHIVFLVEPAVVNLEGLVTDFGYKGSLKHETPEPYVWDESFKVDYSRLDEEHDALFANILAVSQHPDDAATLQVLKDNMEKHFDFEEQRFCSVEHYNCVDHKAKHYKFWVVLEDLKVPVGCEEINWAKNWLAQHIKNTDHQYKTRLEHAEEGANFSGALP